jgi:hypothetical protein
MKATELQNRLAHLTSGETLLLSAAECERAFHFYPTPEERRAAATDLARLYGCSLTVYGPWENQILFTRQSDP